MSYLNSYKRRPEDNTVPDMFSPELVDDDEIYELEEILQKKTSEGTIYYLVKWAGWPKEYNEWVAEEDMSGAPDLLRDFNKTCKRRRKT